MENEYERGGVGSDYDKVCHDSDDGVAQGGEGGVMVVIVKKEIREDSGDMIVLVK